MTFKNYLTRRLATVLAQDYWSKYVPQTTAALGSIEVHTHFGYNNFANPGLWPISVLQQNQHFQLISCSYCRWAAPSRFRGAPQQWWPDGWGFLRKDWRRPTGWWICCEPSALSILTAANSLAPQPQTLHFAKQCCAQPPVLRSYKAQPNDAHHRSVSNETKLDAQSFNGEFGDAYRTSKVHTGRHYGYRCWSYLKLCVLVSFPRKWCASTVCATHTLLFTCL